MEGNIEESPFKYFVNERAYSSTSISRKHPKLAQIQTFSVLVAWIPVSIFTQV